MGGILWRSNQVVPLFLEEGHGRVGARPKGDTKVQDDNCLTKSFQCLTCFLVPLAVVLHPFRTFFLGCILVYVRRFCCKLWCLLCNCVCWKVRSFSSESNSWP
jgi:hypothetical protein